MSGSGAEPGDAKALPTPTSAWSPFRHATFTVLWTATVVSKVNGCLSLIKNGNTSSFTGSYKITPKQKITSP